MDFISGKESTAFAFFLHKLKDYSLFVKLRLTNLVVFSSLLGYMIAAEGIYFLDLILLFIGGFLVTASSNGFNQIIERDLDAIMGRTKDRPLPQGRMSVNEAYIVAILSGILGILILWIGFHPLAGILGALGLFLYVVVYTPMKRLSPWAVFVGAFPGAIPPMLGYVAYTGTFNLEAGILFAIQFMWQFPHFWAIAWKAHDDYAKAGFRLLPSKTGKDQSSAFLMLIYSFFLLLVSLLPVLFGFAGSAYAIFSLIAGVVILVPSVRLFQNKGDKAATQVMFASFIYIPIVLIAYFFDKI